MFCAHNRQGLLLAVKVVAIMNYMCLRECTRCGFFVIVEKKALLVGSMQYFNYMGMLAVEGSYDKMEALLSRNIHPVDILLLMASSEGDKPKIEELLRAGAKYDVKDAEGRTALDRAASEEIKDFILGFSVQRT